MLGGMVGIIKGPLTRVGMMLMKSMLFFSAKSHAACSASVFDTKYICRENEVFLTGDQEAEAK